MGFQNLRWKPIEKNSSRLEPKKSWLQLRLQQESAAREHHLALERDNMAADAWQLWGPALAVDFPPSEFKQTTWFVGDIW